MDWTAENIEWLVRQFVEDYNAELERQIRHYLKERIAREELYRTPIEVHTMNCTLIISGNKVIGEFI